MKKFNEFIKEASNYPLGADEDPNAPWNQREPVQNFIVQLNNGEVILLTTYDGEVQSDETITLDPYYVDKLLEDKADIELDDGEGFEITSIDELEDDKYNFITDKGEFEVDLYELQNLI